MPNPKPDITSEQAALQKVERRLIGLAAALAALPAAASAHDGKLGGETAVAMLDSLKPDLIALAGKLDAAHATLQMNAATIGAVLQASGGDDKEPPAEAILRAFGIL